MPEPCNQENKDKQLKPLPAIKPRRHLTKEQQEKLLKQIELYQPTVEKALASINFNYLQEVIDNATKPMRDLQDYFQNYNKAIESVFRQANAISDYQKKLLEDIELPMKRWQESILKATNIYENLFKSFNFDAIALKGLFVSISLSDHIEKIGQSSRMIYDYDEVNTRFNPKTTELISPLAITKETELTHFTYRQTRKLELRLGVYERDLIEVKANQERIIEQNAEMIGNSRQIISILMNGHKRTVSINDIKSDEEMMDVIINSIPMGLTAGSKMQMLAHEMLKNPLTYGKWLTFDELESVLPDELSDEELKAARRHLNVKFADSKFGLKEFIELDNCKLRINPKYL